MRNVLVISASEDNVVNVIVLDGRAPAAPEGFRFVTAKGDLLSAGIGWTVSADGTATPPPVPEVVDDAGAIAAQLAELQARLIALQAANGGAE